MSKKSLYMVLIACISVAGLQPAARPDSAAAAAAAGAGGALQDSYAISSEDRKRVAVGLNYPDIDDPLPPKPLECIDRKFYTLATAGHAIKIKNSLILPAIARQCPKLPRPICDLIAHYAQEFSPWLSDTIAIKQIKNPTLIPHPWIFSTKNLAWVDDDHIVYLKRDTQQNRTVLTLSNVNNSEHTIQHPLDAHVVTCYSDERHPERAIITTADRNHLITFWDRTLTPCGTLQIAYQIKDITFSPDGTKMCVISEHADEIHVDVVNIEERGGLVVTSPCYAFVQDVLFASDVIINWLDNTQFIISIFAGAGSFLSNNSLIRKVDTTHKTVEKIDKKVHYRGAIDPSIKYLITPAFHRFFPLRTPKVSKKSLSDDAPTVPLLTCQDATRLFKDSPVYFNEFSWKLKDLLIVSGYYYPKDERDPRGFAACIGFVACIDATTGRLIKIFKNITQNGYASLSPNGSKLVLADERSIAILSTLPEKSYEDTQQYQRFLKHLNFYNNLAKLYRYNRLLKSVSVVYSPASHTADISSDCRACVIS